MVTISLLITGISCRQEGELGTAPVEESTTVGHLPERDLLGRLRLALSNDDPEEVIRLVRKGVDVNSSLDSAGNTPLMISRSPSMVALLLKKGADPNQKDDLA